MNRGTPLAGKRVVNESCTMSRMSLIDPAGRWLASAGGDPVRAVHTPAPTADLHADFTGQTCLRTNLVTKRVLDAAEAGKVVEIISDNLSSVETIPFMLEGHGCEHLATVHHGDHWRIYARKRQLPR